MFIILLSCSISAVIASLVCFLIGPKRIEKISKPLSLIAIGFLISLALAHIIPEAMEAAEPHNIGLTLLVGVLLLTVFEMFFNTHDHHDHKNALANGGAGILSGSFMHTFCDGVVIASAYMTSEHLGYVVTIAVLSHEIAHELGDYVLVMDCGMTSKQAYSVNVIALIGCVLGGITSYFVFAHVEQLLPYALALSGASFIYVSLSDLLPRLRHASNKQNMLKRFFYILVGVAFCLVIAGHD